MWVYLLNKMFLRETIALEMMGTIVSDMYHKKKKKKIMEFLEGRIFSDMRMLTLPYEEKVKW